MQIKADVCGRVFRAAQCSEATAMGAALLAAWGAGLIDKGTIPESGTGRSYEPDTAADYEKAYAQYKTLYRAVKPLF